MTDYFKVSVVIPAFNEAENIPELLTHLIPVLKTFPDYEVIIVDDGSTDHTLATVREAKMNNPNIHYLSFSRNFGHQCALRAGLEHACGDCVITLDADLQHPVDLIPTMIQLWKDGNDVVYTIRDDTALQNGFKKLTSRLFYRIFRFITGLTVPRGAADFRLVDKKVVSVIRNSPERNLFLRGYISWIGFNQIGLPYQVGKRFSGKSHYTLRKMLALAWSGITSFGVMPLRLAGVLGFFTTGMGFLYCLYVLYMKIFTDTYTVSGWASVLVSVLILGGIQLIILGILGEYLGLVYLETKHRPTYIIAQSDIRDQSKI